jgi:Fic-DOC domain mobile mystery protein B
MLGDVWTWAGDYRKRATNIGVAPHAIPGAVKALVDDSLYQVSILDELPWDADELAVRFHYRLVTVHPFPNGNGRHARLCADILVSSLGRPPFTWGGEDLSVHGTRRDEYLDALRTADREQEFTALHRFARS